MRLLTLLLVSILFSPVYAQEEYRIDDEFKIAAKGELHLKTNDADVEILGTNRQNASVFIYHKISTSGLSFGDRDFTIDIEESGGNLYITEQSRTNTFGIGSVREEYQVRIEIPAGVSLDIRGDDDDYDISGVNGSIVLHADEGDINLADCNGSRFEFDIDDGDISMEGGKGTLIADLDDGDIDITNAEFTSVNAAIDDGELTLYTSLSDEGKYRFRIDDGYLRLVVNSGGGRFEVDHDDSRLRADDAYRFIDQDDDYSILEVGNGSAQIRITSDDATIRLEKR